MRDACRVGGDRRLEDDESHAHKRYEDEFARLHKRFEDNDHLVNELIKAKFESLRMHNDTMQHVKALTEALNNLATSTAGIRRMETNVIGLLSFLSDINQFIALIWKPLVFVAVCGGAVYVWLHGKVP